MRDWRWKKNNFSSQYTMTCYCRQGTVTFALSRPCRAHVKHWSGMFDRVTFWPSNTDWKHRSRPSIDHMFVLHGSGKPVISSCPLKRIIMVMKIPLIRLRSLKVPHNNNNNSIMNNKTKDTLIWKFWLIRKPMLKLPSWPITNIYRCGYDPKNINVLDYQIL